MIDREVPASADAAMDEPALDPALEVTQAEIDAWAERERQRRAQWLNGPSPEEREAYAHRVRTRRIAAAFDEGEERLAGTMRQGHMVGLEGQLAMEGAMAVFYRWSRRTFADLVRAGREWEEETTLPNVRRRVSLNDEDS
jgi:hypothetical protein